MSVTCVRKQFSVKQRIIDIHIQEQNMRLRNSKKLNTLMKFYKSNSRPSYVDILNMKRRSAMQIVKCKMSIVNC